MVFLEIFAGSGNLSKAAREVGYRIHPVDSTTKRQTAVAMHVLDLTKDSDAYVLLDLVCNANIASGHLAPPCGIAYRSRERPLPAELSHIKSLPLRSGEHPLGLPGLENLDATRVAASNRLYALTLLVACILHLRNSWVSIENSSNSHFWSILTFFAKQYEMIMPSKHVCMEASGRSGLLLRQCLHCTQQSGRSATACNTRAGDPMHLDLQRFSPHQVRLNIPSLLERGTKFPSQLLTSDAKISARQLRQFGKKQLPPLLSEY